MRVQTMLAVVITVLRSVPSEPAALCSELSGRLCVYLDQLPQWASARNAASVDALARTRNSLAFMDGSPFLGHVPYLAGSRSMSS
jgi:hypothetical protein